MKKIGAVLLAVIMSFSIGLLAACVGEDTGGASVVIKYWGSGGIEEDEVFKQIVTAFNTKYKGDIYVKYEHKPSTDGIALALNGSSGPDVFYMDEPDYKQFAKQGYLLDLSTYLANSEILTEEVLADTYDYTFDRYRYNVTTTSSNKSDPLWAYPKDLAPTVIYYNKKHFDSVGITIVSETEEAIAAYNRANPDSKKSIKAYYTGGDGKKYFNNRIAMSWQEVIELSDALMKGTAQHGFYTEWWFNYLWSIGGDCIQYAPTEDPQYNGGYYQMSFQDSAKNYIVRDDCEAGITVNGRQYAAGELIAYLDRAALTAPQKASCNELPSAREAFTEFIRLAMETRQTVDVIPGDIDVEHFYGADGNRTIGGYQVSPPSSSISSDGRNGYFSGGTIGMLVSTSSAIRHNTDNIKDSFGWGIAPMLRYKEYSADGTEVLVHGVKASHSGSVGIGVNKKSPNADGAVRFAEFIASPEGQMIQAEAGFAVPYYKSLAGGEAYRALNRHVENVEILAEACEIGSPGDWWYLYDKKWIDDWANYLNGTVRNAKASLTKFFDDWIAPTNELLKAYTKK
jgi:ABC-type glycerol-3-phosphate transport system substrate-binding protein